MLNLIQFDEFISQPTHESLLNILTNPPVAIYYYNQKGIQMFLKKFNTEYQLLINGELTSFTKSLQDVLDDLKLANKLLYLK